MLVSLIHPEGLFVDDEVLNKEYSHYEIVTFFKKYFTIRTS